MFELKATLVGGESPIRSGATPNAAHNTRSLSNRVRRADAGKMVASRLLAARELNGYSQTRAAELFGYKTPAQLSLWELGRRPTPLAMLIKACEVYRVSMDYLTGISEEPDRDPASAVRRQVLVASEGMLSNMAHALADAMIQQTKLGGPAVETALLIVEEGEKLVMACHRFIQLNQGKFEDMRGGAPLQAAATSFEANGLATARAQIDRFARANQEALQSVLKRVRRSSANDELFE